jgi:ABC-type nitrate/sulfonate/bicarbonate transport system permease component
VARALKGTINSELVIRSAGLGYLLLRYSEELNVAATMAIAATCCLLVIAVTQAVTWTERRLLRWSA